MPRPSVAAVRISGGAQPSRAVSWNFRFATSTSSFPRSALFTTYTSPISRIPAFIVWTASPVIGISTTTVVCARVAISTSLCPAPTVSTNTMSMPSASRTRTASKVARASPPAWPRVAIDRMKTPGSTPVSAIRIRSPSTAPPVYGDVGSTATTPTFRSRLRYFRTSRLIRELFPTPGGPVNPTTWARPVCGKIRARASIASGSSSSIREMSFAAARLLPASKSSTRSETESCAAPFRAGTASRTFARRLKKRDDVSERRPGSEDHLNACLLELRESLLPDAEGLPHYVDDFAQGRLRPHRVEDEGHRVRVAFATLAELVEGPRVLLRVSRPPDAPETFHLGFQGRLAHSKRLEFRLLVDDEVVHAHNDPLLVLDLPLIPIRRVRDLLLEEPFPDRGDHAAELLDPIEVSVGLVLQLVREGFEEVGPAERIDRVRDAALVGEDLLGSERDAGRGLVRHLIGLVVRVRMEGLRPTEDGGERLDRRPDDVDLGLLRGEADAGRLRVESEEPGTRVLRPERVPHLACPDPAGRAVLREFLEQIVVRVEEEGQAGREVVHPESAVDAPADVFHAVRQGEGQLLPGGRPRLANVIAADRDRVPLRHLRRGEFERVDDEPHGRFRREDPLLLGLIFFQDVVLDRAAELRHRDGALLRRDQVHRPDHGGRTVDRHRRAHLPDVDPTEEEAHVLEGGHCDPASPELPLRLRLVRVVSVQGRHVERNAEARLPVRDQILEPPVRVLRAPVAGEHPHRPQATAVHGRMDPACVGELARLPESLLVRLGSQIEGRVQAPHRAARSRDEFFSAFRQRLHGVAEGRVLPPFPFFLEGLPVVLGPHERLGAFKRPCL